MSAFDTLPVILISTINETSAKELVSELIDNDVTEDYLKDSQCLDRVWRLVNKYYTVNVRVHTLTDHGQLEVDLDSIEAHVIHITEEEASDGQAAVALAERRAAGAGAGRAWRRAGVRVLACGGARVAGALRAWAAAQRALAQALAGAGHAARAEPGGAAPVRAALHAHAWRGLVRTDRAAPPPVASAGSSCAGSDESACSESSDSEEEERRAVEQAEAFAAALGALGPALAARPAPDPHPASPAPHPAPRAADREQAEALVLAFCRALGLDPDTC